MRSGLVRRARLDEVPAIHALHMRSIREVCAKDYTFEQIEASAGRPLNAERRRQAILNDDVWVVEVRGDIFGYGHLVKDQVTALYLLPEILGQGFGREILAAMKDTARTRGATALQLKSTRTAQGFYQSQGFVRTSEVEECHTIAGVGIPCIAMECRLA